jgi:2-polyprenyl-6-methoxyphenol hydroxylase-like FAD-dependent oxidoreductase
MNVAVVFPTSFAKAYDSVADLKKHMLEMFSDFHPSSIALLGSADEVSIWTLYDLPALSTWSHGCVTLMGDAAHPILPYAAQGAAQALEDAATLAVVLGRGTKAAQVSQRLQLYFDIRHQRANWVQDFARGADQSTPENPGVKPEIDPAEFFKVVYDHDVWQFAEDKLREHLQN